MPLIQLKLGPEMEKLARKNHLLQQVAFRVAETMEWSVERLTVTSEVMGEEDWFHQGGRQPLAMIYWLEGKSPEERRKMMQAVACAMATALQVDFRKINVMVMELKQGALLTEGKFL